MKISKVGCNMSKLKKQEKRAAQLQEKELHNQEVKSKILETQMKLRKAIAKGNKAVITRYTNQLNNLRTQL